MINAIMPLYNSNGPSFMNVKVFVPSECDFIALFYPKNPAKAKEYFMLDLKLKTSG